MSIPSTNRVERLAENLGRAALHLSAETVAALDAASAAIPTEGLRLPEAVLAMSGL